MTSASPPAAAGSWLAPLRTRRWIGLTALALLGIVICLLLGRWQWLRAGDYLAADQALAAQPIRIAEAAPTGEPLPASSIGRRVIGSGAYATDQSLFVTSRESQGRVGVWLVQPLVLDDGSAIAVVRGWLPSPASVVASPPLADVRGVLQGFETFYPDAPIQPDGTILAINERVLQQAWGRDIRPGVVILAEQQPMLQPSPVMVPATAGPAVVALPWQNYFYAIQWWVFGLFVILMWVRFLRLEAREIASQP